MVAASTIREMNTGSVTFTLDTSSPWKEPLVRLDRSWAGFRAGKGHGDKEKIFPFRKTSACHPARPWLVTLSWLRLQIQSHLLTGYLISAYILGLFLKVTSVSLLSSIITMDS